MIDTYGRMDERSFNHEEDDHDDHDDHDDDRRDLKWDEMRAPCCRTR